MNVLILKKTVMMELLAKNNKANNPFVPNAPFLYPLKTSQNHKIFYFQGVERGCIGNEWVNHFRKKFHNSFKHSLS